MILRLLDIGCGPTAQAFEGYRVVGIDREGGGVRGDVCALPFRHEVFDYAYASHIFEHLPSHMLLPALAEWQRVLLPGAILWIRVPNLLWACKRICDLGLDGIGLWTIFGDPHATSFYLRHATGFTLNSLRGLIQLAPEWELMEIEAKGSELWPEKPVGEGQEIHAFLRKR